ncbi:MAG: quinone-dependent dihydroorotate dehydrogenase [Bacteroidia bacterium]|nr:quinone-dependent dihydroorotate dehydrogenase [Bacteroidia bacterium]
MWPLLRKLLFGLEAERAHHLVFWLAKGLDKIGLWRDAPPSVAPLTVWNIRFAHPVGLAAGLDKNGELLNLWRHLGFAFVEVGTVTPRPQPGNPPPRLFRIPAEEALLNRMGFNNKGAYHLAARLEKRPPDLIVGINIGKNKDTPLHEAAKDYAEAFRVLRDLGDFFVLNISSPNTPGLQTLQTREHIYRILEAVSPWNRANRPILLKLSPDLSEEEIQRVGEAAQMAGVVGFVAGNTTTSIRYPDLGEGGVSGRPLQPLRQRLIRALNPFGLPIIGVGGIFSSEDVREALQAGATLVEVYTALVYRGPSLLQSLLYSFRTP